MDTERATKMAITPDLAESRLIARQVSIDAVSVTRGGWTVHVSSGGARGASTWHMLSADVTRVRGLGGIGEDLGADLGEIEPEPTPMILSHVCERARESDAPDDGGEHAYGDAEVVWVEGRLRVRDHHAVTLGWGVRCHG